ncbi:MAG TPA: hypothetical protein VK602_13380 [Phyllobacterium sp.]|nr:hypothetical protein [Phyllobacterium sp.]
MSGIKQFYDSNWEAQQNVTAPAGTKKDDACSDCKQRQLGFAGAFLKNRLGPTATSIAGGRHGFVK